MLKVFEVHFADGTDPDALLSPEVLEETGAQVMTFAEAERVGFAGLPAPPDGGGPARLIAVSARDERWIARVLETSEIVSGYRVHSVDD